MVAGSSALPLDMVLPRYHHATMSDVLPTVAAALGQPDFVNRLGFPSSRHYVVVVVDGLGLHNLAAAADMAPFLSGLASGSVGEAMTAGVPSTTATSLTSFGTGLQPGRHGMVGYSFRLPKAKGAILNPLTWQLPHSPSHVQPHPTVFERLAPQINVTTVSLALFSESGLTQAALRGPQFRGVDRDDDRQGRLDAVLAAVTPDRPSLVYAYDRRLDKCGHGEGWESQAWQQQLAAIDAECRELRSHLPADCTLVITADHGMIDRDATAQVTVEDHQELGRGVDAIAGECRFRHIYVDQEHEISPVALRWQQFLGERAWVRTRDEAIAEGWFGPVDEQVRERLGHVVVAMRERYSVMTKAMRQELSLVGVHGSLTRAEMEIPCLVAQSVSDH